MRNATSEDFSKSVSQSRPRPKATLPSESAEIERMFPTIAQWVQDGHIEIGDQEGFGFVIRALDYAGLVFEDDKAESLAEAMAVLENELRKWFKEQGIILK